MEKDHTTVSTAFLQLRYLFQGLGLESSPSKDCAPSTRMAFLGLVYDTSTLKMSIEVTQDKLDSITLLVRVWLNTSSATKTALKSLIGKLAFFSASISPGRIFMHRMPSELRLLTYNGVSLIRSEPQINNPLRFCTDASLQGIGGFYDGRFHAT